jgi:hypothetical protein
MKKAGGKLHWLFQLFDARMGHQSSMPVACTEIVGRDMNHDGPFCDPP